MSYSHLGQTVPAATPVAPPAAPWVSGFVFMENLAQELNRVGGTFDTTAIHASIQRDSLVGMSDRSVRVAQTAPDTVVITVDYPSNINAQTSATRDTFSVSGVYAPDVLMRAYTLSQSGHFTLDTGLLWRRALGYGTAMLLSFWWGKWWEKRRERRRRAAA